MKVIYIVGPFRGKNAWEIEQNIRRAEAAALKVWLTGKAVPICPHTMNRFYQGAGPDDIWLAGDIELLRRSDAVLAVGDITRSSGSMEEIRIAQDGMEIPTFHENDLPQSDGLPAALREWLAINA